ncbi:MAG TPA: 4-hydroxybenzoate octaprenyltransferase [Xanthobacteraceae bacterium]|nr:4-hydroxybenzoate octaprenyltransferase [Xanthobacteraceae bacterium]
MNEGRSATAVADSTGNWVDRHAPAWARPYLQLARLDRPIGWWLLLLPCWWSTGLAAIASGARWPDLKLLALFLLGAVTMRGAGCTWNDILDRDLDARVERTRSRPIPSGRVSLAQAFAFLVALALIGLLVLAQMNAFAIAMGIASLLVVSVYPLAKRVTWFPQAVLGLAFSWGALMGWAAVFGRIDWPALILYAGSILWVIGYDTIYAHQDRDDDAIIGVRSTARLFGEETRPALVFLYAGAVLLILIAGIFAGGGILFDLGVIGFALHLAWQVRTIDIGNPAQCLGLFRANREAGLILFAGIVLDAAFGSPGAFIPAR